MLGFAELLLISVLGAVLVLAAWTAFRLARRKGRDGWTRVILTLLFLPALLVLALLPRRAPSRSAGASESG